MIYCLSDSNHTTAGLHSLRSRPLNHNGQTNDVLFYYVLETKIGGKPAQWDSTLEKDMRMTTVCETTS
jgi:hypothetical protein